MMEQYFHSVRLDESRCRGCTNCIKRCPTEAIRVKDGKARITDARCIDCGECIRNCPNHAKIAVTDTLDMLEHFDYKIALIAPSFFGQFKSKVTPEQIIAGVLACGFDDYFEAAHGAEVLTELTKVYLRENHEKRPLIGTSCPVILRLIQVKFPNLVDNIILLHVPIQIAAAEARRIAVAKTGLSPEKIGIFFITPCPAKVTSIRQPEGCDGFGIDGAVSMHEVAVKILQNFGPGNVQEKLQATGLGLGWGRASGETEALANSGIKVLSVDGIHNVISVLQEVDMGKFEGIDYIDCNSCTGGCVGGVLTLQNPYVAKVRIQEIAEGLPKESKMDFPRFIKEYEQGRYLFDKKIEPRQIMKLDNNMTVAMQKLEQLEKVLEGLPQLDCGACGCPTCRALAEDIVQGQAVETDCIFKMRGEVENLAEIMLELAKKVPPAMGTDTLQKKD